MLLPHLRDSSAVELASVATTTSLSGVNAQRKFGFRTVSTDVDAVLDDDSLAPSSSSPGTPRTRRLVCRALERGHTCSSRSRWPSARSSSRRSADDRGPPATTG
jgi:hypothetical protein